MQDLLFFVSVSVVLLCVDCSFGETVAYQFKADDFSTTIDSATWAAVDGGSVMTSVHELALKHGMAIPTESDAGIVSHGVFIWQKIDLEKVVMALKPDCLAGQMPRAPRFAPLLDREKSQMKTLGIVSTLTAMGIDTGGLFDSVFLVR